MPVFQRGGTNLCFHQQCQTNPYHPHQHLMLPVILDTLIGVVISHCGLNLYFCHRHWCWTSFYVLICHLYPLPFSHSVVSDSLQPHGLQHTRLPCPSPPVGVCLNLCPLSRWCHPTIWSSLVPFYICPYLLPIF